VAGPGKRLDVASLLSEELRTLDKFVALLQKEQALLASGISDGLTALAGEKSAAAVALGRLAAQRDQELTHLHLPPVALEWMRGP
jgi:hypothetical protein